MNIRPDAEEMEMFDPDIKIALFNFCNKNKFKPWHSDSFKESWLNTETPFITFVLRYHYTNLEFELTKIKYFPRKSIDIKKNDDIRKVSKIHLYKPMKNVFDRVKAAMKSFIDKYKEIKQ